VNAAAVPSEGELPEDAVEVGRVLGAWGIKGGIKVKPFAADPQALFSSKRWFIRPPEPSLVRPGGRAEIPSLLRVIGAKEHGDGVVATVQEVPDRTAAEALKGARIFISRASFPTPDADEFYWVDLIGLDVVGRSGVVLGRVVGLLETGPHCVLRVQPASGAAKGEAATAHDAPAGTAGDAVTPAEVLIPFVAAYVDKVDLPARRILVDWEADY
jgi:16S rRNA processing protein RimM